MLKAVAQDHPDIWPQRLPTVMAAYRITVHQTTGVTSNMAMLGREVILPATLIARPPEEFHPATVLFVRDLRDDYNLRQQLSYRQMIVSKHKQHFTQKL